MQRRPAFKLAARADGLFRAVRPGDFTTTAVAALDLTFDGIAGDRHAGATRRSGGREPWYPRGTETRNERQVSLVAADELAAIAAVLGLPTVEPEWLGANLLVSGVANLTLLPPRSLLLFAGGATIRIDGLNTPCRKTGRAIAARFPDHEGLDFAFLRAGRDRRGLVGWVEKPGTVRLGETIDIRVPEQRLYPA
jgi:hypothetical protein